MAPFCVRGDLCFLSLYFRVSAPAAQKGTVILRWLPSPRSCLRARSPPECASRRAVEQLRAGAARPYGGAYSFPCAASALPQLSRPLAHPGAPATSAGCWPARLSGGCVRLAWGAPKRGIVLTSSGCSGDLGAGAASGLRTRHPAPTALNAPLISLCRVRPEHKLTFCI